MMYVPVPGTVPSWIAPVPARLLYVRKSYLPKGRASKPVTFRVLVPVRVNVLSAAAPPSTTLSLEMLLKLKFSVLPVRVKGLLMVSVAVVAGATCGLRIAPLWSTVAPPIVPIPLSVAPLATVTALAPMLAPTLPAPPTTRVPALTAVAPV